MSGCNQCGGHFRAVPSGIDVTATPALTGLMLACESCGRPIRLLHRSSVPRPLSRAERNRVARANRRMGMSA